MQKLLLSLILTLVLTAPALAQSEKRLGTFGDWAAYSYNEGKNKICYMVSQPQDTKPDNVNRGDIYLMVTHRPADKVRDEVSVYVGYPLKAESTVEAVVGDDKFGLFTAEDAAWAPDVKTDRALVDAFIKGNKLILKGISTRGTHTTDTYSLSGFTAAHNAIGKACD